MTGQAVFLDFEASSLGKRSYPIEVAWVFETGDAEAYLIRPAPEWLDWSAEAAGIHGIGRDELLAEGHPLDWVAQRMLDRLTGHQLYASAPSWDGQWLSKLLRAAGLPRHALRLKDTDEAQRSIGLAALRRAGIPQPEHGTILRDALAVAEQAKRAAPPAHRALADARAELASWRLVESLVELAVGDLDR